MSFSPVKELAADPSSDTAQSNTLSIELKPFAPKDVLNFGEVNVGESKVMMLQLSVPQGEEAINCEIQRVKSHFEVERDSLSLTVQSDATEMIPIRWTPTDDGTVSGSLLSIKWGFNGVQVNVIGTAVALNQPKKKINYKGPKKPLIVRGLKNGLRAKKPETKKAPVAAEKVAAKRYEQTATQKFFFPRLPEPSPDLDTRRQEHQGSLQVGTQEGDRPP